MKSFQKLILFFATLFFIGCDSGSVELYVSPSGSDFNLGSVEEPFASFEKARDEIRKLIREGLQSDIIVYFREGTYKINETVILGLEDFSDDYSITYAAYPGEFPIFSGGYPIRNWTKLKVHPSDLPKVAHGNIWVTDLPDGMGNFKVLFEGESFLPRARSEGFNAPINEYKGDIRSSNNEALTTVYFPEGILKNWPNLEDIELLAYPSIGWTMNILPLASVDVKNKIAITTIPSTYPVRYLAGKLDTYIPKAMFMENAIDYLDEPGEWVVNTKEKKIYYWPKSGVPGVNIVAPVLKELIKVEGKIDKEGPTDIPVQNIHFKGLTFMHGERDTWQIGDAGVQHDWEMIDKPSAMLRFRGTENCSVEECRFAYSGGTGLRMDLYCQYNTVTKCLFEELGSMGVLLCGYGPGTKDVNKNNKIINNLFTETGRIYWHGHAFYGFQTGNNLISHNTFINLPRKAIGFSGVRPGFFENYARNPNRRECAASIRKEEINWKEIEGKDSEEMYNFLRPYYHTKKNIIEYNWCENVLYRGADGAAINFTAAGYGNEVHNNLVYNTQNLRVNGIRLDDAVRGTKIYKNILYKGRCLNPKSPDNETYNNILIFSEDQKLNSPECLKFYAIYPGSIVKNVFYYQSNFTLPVERLKGKGDPIIELDYNVYYDATNPAESKQAWDEFRSAGYDQHSLFTDPLFMDIEEKDFRLQENSPLIQMGFEEFTIDSIGIYKDFPEYWNRLNN